MLHSRPLHRAGTACKPASRISSHRPVPTKRSGLGFGVLIPTRAVPDASDIANEQTITLAYGGLGAAAATFLATFFVFPRLYPDKNPRWEQMLPGLRARGVRTLTPAEASKKSRSAVLLDVRLPAKHEEIAPVNSVNVPLYIPIQKWDLRSIIRRIGFASFGVYGTEINPNFVEEVAAVAPKGKEVMVICEAGGSIDAKPGNESGTQSRSLKAVYYLQQAGFSAVSHVSGGVGQWVRDGLPVQE